MSIALGRPPGGAARWLPDTAALAGGAGRLGPGERSARPCSLGSGVYAGHWLDDARRLVDRLEASLSGMPVWLFSSGPVGDPPEPEVDPAEAGAMMIRVGAREHRLFAGKVDKSELGLSERAILAMVRAPEGDFRAWPEIAAWGGEIAASLLAGVAVGARDAAP